MQDELFHFDKPFQLYGFSQLQSDRCHDFSVCRVCGQTNQF
ncbi:Unknown protein sequence [Pseudomonas amygdali pv. lachrymans]|nr:Unknown protein sequence [Pseudomonas amygdali pv. lachrymans]